MYVNPALLPQVTNREDFILTVQVFDDDTFEPINLHNFATASTQEFTSSAWTVQDGPIVTTSSTSITIPQLPSSGELSTLSLTVGTGLDIEEGDPIQISDTLTGLNTMNGYCLSYATATGALQVQIGWTFQTEIRSLPPNWMPGLGYAPWFDIGISPPAPILQATLANGFLKVVDMGTLEIRIPERTFKTLCAGTYGIFSTMSDSYSTRQLFIGRLPVFYGAVTN